jgi:ubiquitin C-terminal hydrolase
LDEKYYVKNQKITYSNTSINQRFKKFLIDSSLANCYNPSDVFSSVGAVKGKFRSMAQQDAQELLRYLLDALSEGEITHLGIDRTKLKSVENKYGKLKLTYIECIFGSYLASRLHCQNCDLISWTLDLCLDLNIEIVRDKNNEQIPIPYGK